MGYQTVFRRYEKKYLVTQEQYDRLAAVFAPRMERDRFSESTISNIYYDTPDFRLIRRSLDRPVYKEKLRLRTYRTPHADTEAFVEIKKKYDKRSGRANAYAWACMGKLAAKLGIKREEVYRQYIPEIGDNYRLVPYVNGQHRDFIADLWSKQGLGWVTQDCNGGYLMCFYGSSTYNTLQMGRLINLIVQDCKEQGIETEPESTVIGWLSKWKPEERGV